ncbi:cytochrome P450 [Nonomuraea gerenzanensis]|uniref:Putative cytochrome P450 hydroxylase n=1 Tax=Nonomuraea gerenzanensis TaxID=93944 RepID=A0A1M4E7Y9_9ACTN|nr:cytochrome P450 [Nonomuraea gerenzanensis]UBU17185.1 cytochrome P450 [Nonomuraea gerenzanensis]SBO94925.1 putative cytochrome P450 hydroxylase [Nonomuraea gerenzanensis]
MRPQPPPGTLDDLDLLDPHLHASHDLTPLWRRLRATDPVRRHDTFWSVTRHADVLRVVRDPDTYTSLRGNMLRTLLRGHDPGAGRMIVVTDGPRHAVLRRVLTPGFGPRTLGPVTHSIIEATRGLLKALLREGGGDFVQEVAAQVPLRAICELLGVPERDRQRVLELTAQAMLGEEGTGVAARIAQSEILLYYTRLAAERRSAPGTDVISLLVSADLTEEEVLLNCYNLIIGGDETARLALAGGLLALATYEAEWARLRADPGLVGTATEEILRWTTPAAHVGRVATRAAELGGRRIEAGEVVALWTVSANRDETVFDDPDRFDVGRRPNRHLTFGHGPHFCLGAQLARAEIEALLVELRASVTRIEVTGPVTWLPSNFVNGVATLPVALA